MEFSFSYWLSNNLLLIGVMTLVVVLIYSMFIIKSDKNILRKILRVFVTLSITFVAVSVVSFILGAGDYIQEYRQAYYDSEIKGMEKEYIVVYDVNITNNKGNSIPKFSDRDKNKYVTVEYNNGIEQKTQFVLDDTLYSPTEDFLLSYVYLQEDHIPDLSRFTDVLLQIREKLGYNDVDKLRVESGAYYLRLHVPMEDYDTYQEAMSRVSR